jgi:hypothetical protein
VPAHHGYHILINFVARAKYPIAVVHEIEQNIPGVKCMGYDIGCAFSSTLSKGKIQYTGDYTLPAMHGYCHNRLCQVTYQSIYKTGAGLSDFEQCERFFSASNLVAPLTRHATPFNRHLFIDMHMEQSDREKIANLGKFIFYNYRQALEIIREQQPLIDAAARRDPPLPPTSSGFWKNMRTSRA